MSNNVKKVIGEKLSRLPTPSSLKKTRRIVMWDDTVADTAPVDASVRTIRTCPMTRSAILQKKPGMSATSEPSSISLIKAKCTRSEMKAKRKKKA